MKNLYRQRDLAGLARVSIHGYTQQEASEITGLPQSRISEAINQRNDTSAIWIILKMYEHARGESLTPAYFEPHYVLPESLSDWLEGLKAEELERHKKATSYYVAELESNKLQSGDV